MEKEDGSLDEWKKFMPQIVKAGRDVIILSMIFQQPMSGYDLIKNIFTKTNVFLSQGTVYSILYSFEETNILQAQYGKGDMRSKIYRITPNGLKIAQDRIRNFVLALDNVIKLINAEATYPCSQLITNDPSLNLILDLDESN
jgi:DNA-binding PadR family transcriptional regulator